MKIFIIAGEASGDWMGAKLIRQLRAQNKKVELKIIGGKKMEAQGLESLFPSNELAIMGFAEILPHIPNIRRRISQTVEAIRKFKPDVLVTIDSPGFNFRVAAQLQDLRKSLVSGTKFVHYVAPTVWAYKSERAAKTAALYDKLLCILPFELPYFEEVDLDAKFVGHPIIEDGLAAGDGDAFKKRHKIDDFICMMPGSRKGELERILPVFEKITSKMPDTKFVIIAADYARFTLESTTKNWINPPLIVDNAEKIDCFAASMAGIIKSGTAGLEYAFAGKPFVIAYKVNPLSAYMLRKMIRINFANLVNIMLNKEVIPELLQEDCEADYIVDNLMATIAKPQELLQGCKKVITRLRSTAGDMPSAAAAREILS